MRKQTQEDVATILRAVLRQKLMHYRSETNHMPFHLRLLGRDRMALFSFIQSLNTVFGTSIFEQVAVAIARQRFKRVERQCSVGDDISASAQEAINTIMNELKTATRDPSWHSELERLRVSALSGDVRKTRLAKVDVWLEDMRGHIFLCDIKTAKPNKASFEDYKRTLLEWMAILLRKDPDASVHTLIAIPYNPYEPKPYERWTLRGMFDIQEQLKVGKEFWNFLGGEGCYESLLDVFMKVGYEMRDEIDKRFADFNKLG